MKIMKKEDCIFCKLANGEIPTNTIYEDEKFRVIFDANPMTKGHCLVIPKDHYDNVFNMEEKVAGEAFAVAAKIARAMKKTLPCEGMNILQNNGEVAGQTVFHFHIHVIPRYPEDKVQLGGEPGEANQEELLSLAKEIQKNL
jgi:histidine triad (HIT) family protein